MIHRYSSRRSPLKDFLATRLQGARRCDRIAGFFSSSLLEVAGEALERMTPEGGETCVRVVCNSCLNPLDVQTARAAEWGMHREWCASLPAEIGAPLKARLQRLYDFLESGLRKVNILPDEAFGLIHGKAGVITRTDGSRVCFIGSANEFRTAWVSNYELVWLDESEEEEKLSSLYPLSPEEREALDRFLKILEENRDEDPKLRQVERVLTTNDIVPGGWLSLGCIVFSQYCDSVLWLGLHLSKRLPDEKIGVYAGAAKSGIIEKGEFRRLNRDEIKRRIASGELRLVIGTDAASEGLNLQRLGSLINLDLPWNPTRLEQRKGRIQRIGQLRPEVLIYNMRYRGSVEDRVHQLLSERMVNIRNMFGQIPDTLEDVWVATALRNEEEAKRVIDAVPKRHPFEMRYDWIENVDWESCSRVLDSASQLEALREGW